MRNGTNSIRENRMNELSEEIRINHFYASKITAKYPNGEKTDQSEPVIRHKHLRTQTYVDKVLEKISPFGANTNFMPLNCRLLKPYKRSVLCIIEEPPAMRSIRVDMDMYREAEALKATGQWEEFGYTNFFEENSRPYTFICFFLEINFHCLEVVSDLELNHYLEWGIKYTDRHY
jgi:hypothetical protein